MELPKEPKVTFKLLCKNRGGGGGSLPWAGVGGSCYHHQNSGKLGIAWNQMFSRLHSSMLGRTKLCCRWISTLVIWAHRQHLGHKSPRQKSEASCKSRETQGRGTQGVYFLWNWKGLNQAPLDLERLEGPG